MADRNSSSNFFKKSIFLTVFFLSIVVVSFSQTTEICNDGKDNNGDGKIDCADALCSFAATVEKGCNCFDAKDNDGDGKIDAADTDCASYYGLTFVGAGSTCSITPPPGTAFTSVAPPQTSSQNTADTPAKIAVGDMNGDGVSDITVTSKWNSTIQVVAAATASGFNPGDIMSDFRTPGSKIFPGSGSSYVFEHEVAIADIDKDKIGEMFAIASERKGGPNNPPTRYFLTGFKYATNSLIPLFNAVDLGVDRPGSIGVADFDGDGKAEVYLRNQIYAAESGVKLADGGGNWKTQINAGPVAVNMTGTSNLELVCGNFIYTVPSLASRTLQTLTVFKDMNSFAGAKKFFPKGLNDVNEYGINQASTTSTADFDGDGFLDVFITGAINCSGNEASPCGTNNTTIFYWNVQKGTVVTFTPPDGTYALGWIWGTGRINLVDANGDGKMEALFAAGNKIFCLGADASGNLVQLWVRTINDSLSGILSITVYDFDNDGNPEVVYRDSQQLVVCDGKTGATTKWSAVCQSHTFTEGPIIADVNGDGGTDICITCYTNAGSFDINKSTPQQQSLAQTRLYYSSTNAWLPTRSVWNQHPYFVTNINDNLTLPFPQIDPSLIFGNVVCPNGVPGPQRPLNLFMDQVPRLSRSGCPEFPAPDLAFFGDDPANPGVDSNGDGVYSPTVVITPPICGNLDIKAQFNIVNSGNLPITDNMPVSFFTADPTTNPTAAVRLFNTTVPISNLGIDQKYTSPVYSFNGPGTAFTLYIVLYNDGSVLPITLTGSSAKECTISNNIYSVPITPTPFTVTVEKVQDNFKCSNAAPNNGILRSRIFISGVEVVDYSPFSFQWYTGNTTASPVAGATQYNLQNLDAGTYSVVVTNIQKGCKSAIVPGTLVRTGNDPPISITVVSNQTVCSPPNGELFATVTDGTTGYTYDWFDISLNSLGITGQTAKNLSAGNYIVRASKDGCSKNSTPVTVNGPLVPDAGAITLTDVQDCSNPNTGSVQADAYFNGVKQNPANYTFDWYFYNNVTSTTGSILPAGNGTGQTRTLLSVGYYQVVITDNVTKCVSTQKPFTQVKSTTVIPTASIAEVAPQTSCDPTKPNGILTSQGIGTGLTSPADFTFEWFKGDNTLPANKVLTVSGAKGETVNQVAGGGIYYTVKVKTSFNCIATAKYIISENVVAPVLTLTQLTPNTVCDVTKATNPYNGSLQATVTFGGSSVTLPDPNYTFSWFDGTTTTTAHTPATSSSNILSGLKDANYAATVSRTDLFCTSVPKTIPITKAALLPVLAASSTGSNNCDPALTPDGTVTVSVSNAIGTDVFAYQWYKGNSIVPANALGAANNGTSATAIKVGGPAGAPNPYTVYVLNKTTGCENNTTQFVADNSIIPVLSFINITPNSICSPSSNFNGSLTAQVNNIPVGYTIADYTFKWYDGNSNASPVNPKSSTALLNKLDAGSYTVDAKNTKTGCQSAPITNNVPNTKIFPALLATATGSNNCDPLLTPDGTVTYAVTNLATDPGPFTQQWYSGAAVVAANALGAANNGTSVTAIKVGGPTGAPKPFTVEVKNTVTGCTNFTTTGVPDNSSIPVLSTVTNPNSVCSPTTNFSGSMTASVTNIPAGYVIGDYTFTWYDGNTTATAHAPQPSPATTVTLPKLDAGTYSVVGVNSKTGCISAIATNQVANTKIFPALLATATGSNNCDPLLTPDGTVTYTVTNLATDPGPFTQQWYSGAAVVVANALGAANNGTSVTAIKVGGPTGAPKPFTVEVTNTVTGCTNFTTTGVPDNSSIPVLSTVTNPNSVCSPTTNFSGSMTASVTNIPAGYVIGDYTFTWYDGNTTATAHAPQPSPATTVTLPKLDAGTYSVVGVNSKTGCISAIATNQVANTKIFPALLATATGSNNCDPLLTPDGTVTYTVTNLGVDPGPFTQQWYSGAAVVIANALGAANNGTSVTAIKVGGPTGAPKPFTVEVTNTVTGCTNFTTTGVPDNSSIPVLSTVTNPNSVCSPTTNFSGSMTASVTNIPAGYVIGDYTFTWYDGNTTTTAHAPQPSPATTVTLPKLDAGTYSVVGVNSKTGCISAIATNQVANTKIFPALLATATGSNNCDPLLTPDGTVTYTVTNLATDPGPFTQQWYSGAAVVIANALGAANNGTSVTAIKVGGPTGAPKPFTVEVTNTVTGCTNFTTTGVPDNSSIPVLSTVTNPNSVCSPTTNFSGSMTASVTNIPAGYVIGDYTFTWYDGNTTTTAHAPQPSPATTVTLPKLDAGTYSVVGVNSKTGCISSIATNQVANTKIFPALLATATGSNNCDPLLTPDGTVTYTVTNLATDPGPFTQQWYSGAAVVIANALGAANNGTSVTAIKVGGPTGAPKPFTVEVTNTVTGCTNFTTTGVPDNSSIPVLSTVTNPNSVCSPTTNFSGSMTASVTNIPAGYVIGDYTFTWYDGNTTATAHAPQPSPATTVTLPKLDAGTYSVVGVNSKTGCISSIATNQVANTKIFPALLATATGSNNCDPLLTPDGTVTYTVTNLGVDPGPFTQQWYSGAAVVIANALGAANNGTSVTAIKVGGPTGAPKPFTVEVTNTVTGCTNFTTTGVPDNSSIPVLSTVTNPNSVCSPTTNFSGSMTASVTNIPAGYVIGDYTFTWYDGNTTTTAHAPQPSPATTVTLPKLDAGTYSVVGVNSKTGCISSIATNQVVDQKVYPVIQITSTGSHNCDPLITPDGTITATVTNTAVVNGAGPFSYLWSAIAPATLLTAANNITLPTATSVGGPTNAPNSYNVVITNTATGCFSNLSGQVADLSAKPTLVLQPFDNTVCDKTLITVGAPENNGHVDITSVSNNVGAYAGSVTLSYSWFDVNPLTSALTANVTSPTNTTASLTLLDNAKYAAKVRITELGCISDPVIAEVLDNITLPIIVNTVTPNVNCISPNGSAQVTSVDGTAVGATTNYLYDWYNGGTVSGAIITSTALLANNLAGPGTQYTVQVTDKRNGCQNNKTATIVDSKVTPTIALSVVQNNTICTGTPNGELVAAVNNAGAAFTITWAAGGTQSAAPGDHYLNLAAAGYSANVKDNATGCVSADDSESIIDNFTYPSISITVVDQSSCTGTPNGKLTATSAGVVVYNWFDGTGIGGAPHAQTAANSGIIDQLPSSDYTVKVTNANGCVSTLTDFVPNNIVKPTLAFTSVGPVTICGPIPGGLIPDGTATASLMGISPAPNFDVFYVRTVVIGGVGAGTYPTNPAVIKASLEKYSGGANPTPLTDLAPGYITALVVDKNTGCESAPTTASIVDATALYTFQINGTSAAGLCSAVAPGGTIDITVNKNGVPCVTCGFKWYDVTPTNNNINFFNNPPNMGGATPITTSEDITLLDPVPGGGGVSAGDYTVVVQDAANGCGAFKVSNIPTANPATIIITPTQPTLCVNASNPTNDGIISVQVTKGATNVLGYTVNIYSGNAAVPANLLGSSGINLGSPFSFAKNSLDNGDYFIEVVDETASNKACPQGRQQTLTGIAYNPIVSIDQITPNTSCDPNSFADGKIKLTVTKDVADSSVPNYRVTNITPAPVITFALPTVVGTGASGQSITINGLEPQNVTASYSVTITDNISGCFKAINFSVPDAQAVPAAMNLAITPETLCANSSNGSALTSLADAETTSHFDFTWAQNNDLSSPVYKDAGDGLNTLGELLNRAHATAGTPGNFWTMGAAGFGSGSRTYFVQGVKNAAAGTGIGCKTEIKQVVITDQHVAPDMALSTIFNSFCTATALNGIPGDGKINITTDADPATGGNQNAAGGFDYTWTNSNAALVPPINSSNVFTIPQLGTGTYQVTATNFANKCAVVNSINIDPAPYVLSVQSHTVIDQRICLADGQINLTNITIDESAAGTANVVETNATPLTSNYDFKWYKANPATPGTFNSAFGQELTDTPGPTAINDQSLISGNAAGQYAAMGVGTYYVVATRKTTAAVAAGCPAQPYRVDVKDVHQNPIAQLKPFSNTSCLPGTDEGEIEIKLTDATSAAFKPVTGFTFTYVWAGTNPEVVAAAVLGASDGDGFGSGDFDGVGIDNDEDHPKQLIDGTYDLVIRNNQSGCTVPASATIIKNATPVFVQSVTATDQIICGNDGSLTVTQVSLNDRTGTAQVFTGATVPSIGNFVFNYDRNSIGNTVLAFSASTTLNVGNYATIGFDSYYVVAKRNTGSPGAGCSSAPFKVDILDKRIFPVVTLTPFANTSCSSLPADLEGEITVKVVDNSPVVGLAGFTYSWSGANPSVIAAAAFPATNNGNSVGTEPDEDNPTQLKEGTYSMTVESNKSRCISPASTTIFKNSTPVFTQAVTPTDQVLCSADGKLLVQEVQVIDRNGVVKSNLAGDFPLSDFTFTYDRTTAGSNVLANTASTQLDNTNYAAIGFDTYFVSTTRVNGGPGKGCSSIPFKVDILDKRIFPVVTLTPFANTSCSSLPADLEGEITVKVLDNSPVVGLAGFTYSWSGANPSVIAAAAFPATNNGNSVGTEPDEDNPTQLKEGTYSMTVESNKSRCISPASTTIFKNSTPVFTQAVTPTDQVLCSADGMLLVQEVQVIDRNGVVKSNLAGDFPLSDFTFTYDRTAAGSNVLANTASTQLDNTNYAAIGFDTYFVSTTRVNGGPGKGCSSIPFKVDILDKRIFPVVTLTPFANTSCSSLPADLEGEITVKVVDNSPVVGLAGFTYSWSGANPSVIAAAAFPATNNGNSVGTEPDEDNPTQLKEGTYSMTVESNKSRCISPASTTIFKNSTPVFTQAVTPTDQVLCSADGMLLVQEVQVIDRNGVVKSNLAGDFPLSDFTFTYDRTAAGSNVLANTASTQLDNTNYAAIGFDTYFVSTTRVNGGPGKGCSSIPFKVDILDKRIFPVVTLTPFANTSCSSLPADLEGEITVKVVDNSPVVGLAGFTYSWSGANPSVIAAAAFPATNNGNSVGTEPDEDNPTQLKEGTYSMTVESNKSRCISPASTTIFKNSTPVFTQAVTPTDQVLCSADGMLLVQEVQVIDRNGVVKSNLAGDFPLSDFTFTYDRTAAGSNVLANTVSTQLDNTNYAAIGFDTYFVSTTRVNGGPGKGCSSIPFKVDILDKRIFPVVTLTPFANTSCSSLPADLEGEITVKVVDNSPVVGLAGFTYSWSGANPSVIAAAAFPATNNGNSVGTEPDEDNPTQLKEGTYSMTVESNKSRCISPASTTIFKNSTPVFTQAVTPTDQVLCSADGMLLVQEVQVIDRNGVVKSNLAGDFPLSDFTFTYDRTAAGSNVLANTASTQLDNTNYAAIGFDTYFVSTTRVNGGPGKGCSSIPFKVDILDKRIFPVVTLTPFANTSCSSLPADLEGEITVKVVDNSPVVGLAGFTYSWSGANPSVIAAAAFPATNNGNSVGTEPDEDNPTQLKEGTYSMTVESNKSRCISPASTTIFKNSTPVFTQAVTPTDQVLCSADGMLLVQEVQVIDRNGVVKSNLAGDFPLSDFTFTYDRTAAGSNVLANTASTQLDNTNYAAIGFDTYFVSTTRVNGGPGKGCSSIPFKVDILDKRIFPVVTLTPFANTSCSSLPADLEGEITVKVVDNSPVVGLAGFTYSWSGANPSVIAAAAFPATNNGNSVGTEPDEDNPTQLKEGTYSMTVESNKSRCISPASTTIFKNSTPVFTQLVTPTDQVLCKADGKLVVNEVKVIDRNGTTQSNLTGNFALSDFTFAYDRTNLGNTVINNASPFQPVITLDNINYPTIGFDSYYVVATRKNGAPGKGCSSAPFKVDIQDKRLFPKVAFTSVANSSCSVAKPNGSLTANASEQNGANSDPYTFGWTINGGALAIPPSSQTNTSNSSVIGNALDGSYIVTATNTITGCPFDASFNLQLDQVRSTPNVIDVTTIDPLDCNPSAQAEVTKITLGSQTLSVLFPPNVPPNNEITGAALLGFNYEWYQGTTNAVDKLPVTTPCIGPGCAPATVGIKAGTYYVFVQDPSTDCKSGPKEVVIKDDNIIYPQVSIAQTMKQISCDPAIGMAALRATALEENGSVGTYDFSWFPSLDLSGTQIGVTNTANPNSITNLVVGNYSVGIKNTTTACTATAFFVVPDEASLFKPVISGVATPRTLCVGIDGLIEVRVLPDPNYPNPPSYNYKADLYLGAAPNPANPPDFANLPATPGPIPGADLNFNKTNLDLGFYTFKVTDNNTACFDLAAVEVKDGRLKPVIEIKQDNPLTNCDPAIANGQLSATADNGKVQGYTFDWFAGLTVTNPAAPIQTNDKLIGESAGPFTVRVTNNFSGCFDDKNGNIIDATIKPALPTAVVVFNRTSCITPNGWVAASVGGSIQNHFFSWYDGSIIKTSADFVDANYRNRDVGPYTVTAKDIVTGCVSPPATVTVLDKRINPVFEVASTPSFCIDTGRPKGNGSIILTLTTPDMVLNDVIWTDASNTQVGLGTEVYDLFPGIYNVKAISSEGCETDGKAEIGTEISPFNGISRNGDNQNDYFIIECISLFPNNNVKIFNRSGILIYEADGYNNSQVSFKGIGEQGLYLATKELPDGTYFYIIDKRDGTKPRTGYLELTR